MKKLFFLSVVLLVVLACNAPTPPVPSGTARPATKPAVVQTLPAAAPTAARSAISPTMAPSVSPQVVPTEPPKPKPTDLPTRVPSPGFVPGGVVPAGLLVGDYDTASMVRLVDLKGQVLGNLNTPALEQAYQLTVHAAGRLLPGGNRVPMIYIGNAGTQKDESINYIDQRVEPLIAAPNASGLIGLPGQPLVAFNQTDFGTDGVTSNVYVGTPQSLLNSKKAMVNRSPQGTAMVRPVALEPLGSGAGALWYTMRALGIGGDVVFEPRTGLVRLDLIQSGAQASKQVLPNDVAFWNLSPDLTWAGYSTPVSGQKLLSTVTLQKLSSAQKVNFTAEANSNRGAGEVVFSPDNKLVGWLEASGYRLGDKPDFHCMIKIGTIDGKLLFKFSDDAIVKALGGGTLESIQPVGWLSSQTLLVEVFLSTNTEDYVHLAAINTGDGTTGSVALFMKNASFVDFVYP